MDVLILSQYYPPEVGATQTRLHSFATGLAQRGHSVTVICEIPNHPAGVYFPGFRRRWFTTSQEDGVRVVRVFVLASPRKTFLRRLAFYLSYMCNAFLVALVAVRARPDVVFASSPPLFVAVGGLGVAVAKRAPFVMDVRDLWPAAAQALGEVTNKKALALAARLELLLYRKAAAVTCVTASFVDYIAALGIPRSKLHHLPNGTLPQVFRPLPPDPGLAGELGLKSGFTVGYLGNHGVAQGLETLLDVAAATTGEVTFLLVGDGPHKEKLESAARTQGLTNLVFWPQVSLERAAQIAALCDVLLVPLKKDSVFSMFVPSKLFDFMACGKPVVLMVEGEAARLLERAGGGVVSPPGDAEALRSVLLDLKRDSAPREVMGRRGREFVLANYDRAVQTGTLETLLESVGRSA